MGGVQKQGFQVGEKVLVSRRLVAIPAVVVGYEDDQITVGVAPESNLTESTAGYAEWEQLTVEKKQLRRYEW